MLLNGLTKLLPAALLATAQLVSATQQQLGIKNGKLSIVTKDGTTERDYSLSPPAGIPEPIQLEADAILRLSFVAEPSEGQIQQAHVQFKDVQDGQVTNLPVVMKGKNRGRFDLKPTSLPSTLRASSGTFTFSLLLGGPSSSGFQYSLGQLTLPSSRLIDRPLHRHDPSFAHPEEGMPAFVALPEIQHTFGKGEKTVPAVVSAVGTAIVLAPWLIFAGIVSRNLKLSSPPTSAYTLLACLIGLEALIFVYWTHWKLYEFLPAFGALSVVSFYVGRVALGQLQYRRLAGDKKAKATSS